MGRVMRRHVEAKARVRSSSIIEFSLTRPTLIAALEMLSSKRGMNPSKKHGNVPVQWNKR